MKKIKKVAILGAGAMGAYFAGRFFDTPGFSTVLIARGDRLGRLKSKGLVINERPYAIPALDDVTVIPKYSAIKYLSGLFWI